MLIETDLASVQSYIASKPISRPSPDSPTPPNGDPGLIDGGGDAMAALQVANPQATA